MDQLTPGLRERTRQEFDRVEQASKNPRRRRFADPLDPRLDCVLGRLSAGGRISKEEYRAAVKWRAIHLAYLHSIQAPEDLSDWECERAASLYKMGCKVLMASGKRVFHAVSAIATYDEAEELGDFEFTLAAARIGFARLARKF